MHTMTDFLNLLFDLGQATCYSKTPEGTVVKHEPGFSDIFFSINALHPYQDLNPTQTWHDKLKPRRADSNVVCYRNFLLEVDTMSLDAQTAYMKDLVPFSSIVYSGSKSYHYIISLVDPVSAEDYKHIAARLHKHVREADKTTKNPSRLSRLPFRMRPDTSKLQELVYLGTRVPRAVLEAVLPEVEKIDYSNRPINKNYLSTLIVFAVEKPDDVMVDRAISGRNAFFYWLYNRLVESNIALPDRRRLVEKAYHNLQNKSGFPLTEALSAARISGV